MMLETITPLAGTPLRFCFAKNAGNNLSFAIAKGICPCTSTNPFNAPNAAMAAPALTQYFAPCP